MRKTMNVLCVIVLVLCGCSKHDTDKGDLAAADLAAADGPGPDAAPPDLNEQPDLAGQDFTVTPTAFLDFAAGGVVSLDVTVARLGGFAGDIAIGFPDLPATLHASPSTLTGGATKVSIPVDSDLVLTATNGTFTVRATSGGLMHDATVHFFLPAATDFAVALGPTSVTVPRSGAGVVTFTITSTADRLVPADITVSGLPAAVTTTPAVLATSSGSNHGTLTLDVGPSAALGGPTTVTVTATSNVNDDPLVRTATFDLTIVDVAPFNLDATPTDLVIRQTETLDVALTVSRNIGFNDPMTASLLAGPPGLTATGGNLGDSETASTLTLTAAYNAELLWPSSVTIGVGVGDTVQTRRLSVIVHPTPDPLRDETFGTEGVAVFDSTMEAPLGTGRVLADGSARVQIGDTAVLALTSEGAVDNAWGDGGLAYRVQAGPLAAVAIGDTGDLFFATQPVKNGEIFVSHRLASSDVDTGFGASTGVMSFTIAASQSTVQRLVPTGDGGVWVLGTAVDSGSSDFVVAKVTSTGVLDTSFASNGVQRIDLGAADRPIDLFPGPAGSVIVVGQTQAGGQLALGLCRLTAAGELDPLFDVDGKLILASDSGSSQIASAATLLSSGKLLIAGKGSYASASYVLLTRLSVDGVLDASFGTGGFAKVAPNFGAFIPLSIVEEPSHALVLGGTQSSGITAELTIARVNANGTPNATTAFESVRGGSGVGEGVASVALDPVNGGIWAFGHFGVRPVAARFKPTP